MANANLSRESAGSAEDFYAETKVAGPEKHPLTPGSKINGGVIAFEGPPEKVSINDKEDPLIETAYRTYVQQQAEKRTGQEYVQSSLTVDQLQRRELLPHVMRVARETMPIDAEKANLVIKKAGSRNEITLSAFFEGGKPHHQALLMAYLLEKISDNNSFGVKVSVETKFVDGPKKGERTWIRFTGEDGSAYILDPSKESPFPVTELTQKSESGLNSEQLAALDLDRQYYLQEGDRGNRFVKKLTQRVRDFLG